MLGGYPQTSALTGLAAYCARPQAGAWPPGWSVAYCHSTDSTQELARAAGAAGAPHGSVFVADWQRAGRGRRGRPWTAPPGTSLLFSILVRDTHLAPFAQTAACTLALCRVLETHALAPRIKWPNDVLLRDRKVAGVLTERVSGDGPPFQIVGIGLNVAYGAARDALPPFATALDWELEHLASDAAPPGPPNAGGEPKQLAAGGSPPALGGWGAIHSHLPRGPLLSALLAALADLLAQPAVAWEARLYGEWLARLWRRRQTVRLALDDAVLEGRVEGAAPDGALLLRLPDGALRRITVGDVLL
jgi:biotin-(acetyl-CoA carboxylase) ligase